jgi:hypothetical protein
MTDLALSDQEIIKLKHYRRPAEQWCVSRRPMHNAVVISNRGHSLSSENKTGTVTGIKRDIGNVQSFSAINIAHIPPDIFELMPTAELQISKNIGATMWFSTPCIFHVPAPWAITVDVLETVLAAWTFAPYKSQELPSQILIKIKSEKNCCQPTSSIGWSKKKTSTSNNRKTSSRSASNCTTSKSKSPINCCQKPSACTAFSIYGSALSPTGWSRMRATLHRQTMRSSRSCAR